MIMKLKSFILFFVAWFSFSIGTSAKSAKFFIFTCDMSRNSTSADSCIAADLSFDLNYIDRGSSTSDYSSYNPMFCVKIKNKTSHTIYIDLGNTFLIRNGDAQAYYIPSATSTTTGKSNGASVNVGAMAGAVGIGGGLGQALGGLNVGGGNSSESTNVTYSQRIIAIPPMSARQLAAQDVFASSLINRSDNDIYYHQNKNGERNVFYLLNMPVGQKDSYTEEDTQYKFSFFVSYSTTEDCAKAANLKADFYVNNIYGINDVCQSQSWVKINLPEPSNMYFGMHALFKSLKY
jgi:hypothetical protein